MNAQNKLQAALKAVREAVIAKQLEIDNEQDPVKKVELAEELKAMVAEAGLVFDGDKAAAEAQAGEAKAKAKEDTKPGFFARTKAWLKEKALVAKEHKVKVAVGVAAAAAAVAGAVYAARNPGAATAAMDGFKAKAGNAASAMKQDQFMNTVGGFFSRVIGAIGNGLVGAKNWIVNLFSRSDSVTSTATVTTTVDLDAAVV